MASNNSLSITGFVGKDPETRFTPKGDSVTSMSVGVTERRKDGDQWVDGDTAWFRVTEWGAKGEAIAETIRKGDLVHVTGAVKLETYEKDGTQNSLLSIRPDVVSVVVRAAKKQANESKTNDGSPW